MAKSEFTRNMWDARIQNSGGKDTVVIDYIKKGCTRIF